MSRFIMLAAILPLFATTPVITSSAAQEGACTTWSAEMLEDEGGPILTASACATDRPDAYLLLTCVGEAIWIRYDLSVGAEDAAEIEEVTDVAFSAGGTTQTLSMTYEEMDGRHATNVPVADPFVALLKSGERLSIVDVPGKYPVHEFSLAGSSSAIDSLIAGCS